MSAGANEVFDDMAMLPKVDSRPSANQAVTKHRKGERLAKSICGRRAVMVMLTGAVFLTGCGEAGGPSGVAEVPDSGGSQSQDAGTLPLGTAIHAKSIAVAVHHACAVLDDGRVACWGTNEWGSSVMVPRALPPVSVKRVARSWCPASWARHAL